MKACRQVYSTNTYIESQNENKTKYQASYSPEVALKCQASSFAEMISFAPQGTSINPFVPNTHFLYPLKTSENRKVMIGLMI